MSTYIGSDRWEFLGMVALPTIIKCFHPLRPRSHPDHNWASDMSMRQVFDCTYGLLLAPEPDDPLDSVLAAQFYGWLVTCGAIFFDLVWSRSRWPHVGVRRWIYWRKPLLCLTRQLHMCIRIEP